MQIRQVKFISAALGALLIAASGQAQDDPEAGLTDEADLGASAGGGASTSGSAASSGSSSGSYRASSSSFEPSSSGSSGDTRLAIQGRIDALNVLGVGAIGGGGITLVDSVVVPIVTPGVRFTDGGKLFLGLGLGFESYSHDAPNGNSDSQSSFSLSPMVTYDFLDDRAAALYFLGWLNFVSVSETEDCDDNGCDDGNNGESAWGLNAGLGIRGKLSEGLALGSEFGWGFLSVDTDSNNEFFVHGLWGTIIFEASIGI